MNLLRFYYVIFFFNHGVYYLYIQIYRSKEIHKDFDRHGRRIIVLDDPSDKMRERLKLYKNNRNNKLTIVPSSFGARAKTVFLKYFTCILYICDTFFFLLIITRVQKIAPILVQSHDHA